MNTDQTVRPAEDAGEARWIADAIRPFADGVGSVVPPVFEAYARVFHPAYAEDGSRTVTWQMVAAFSGRTMHALAQFGALLPQGDSSAPRPFSAPPDVGELPPATLQRLMEVLVAYTARPDDCHFAVWEGFGWVTRSMRRAARLRLPERTYLLFRGPLSGVREIGWQSDAGAFHPESPCLLWPSDRSWFLGTEIDLDSTFVGGSLKLVTSLIADPGVEVWPVSPTDPITADSDRIN